MKRKKHYLKRKTHLMKLKRPHKTEKKPLQFNYQDLILPSMPQNMRGKAENHFYTNKYYNKQFNNNYSFINNS